MKYLATLLLLLGLAIPAQAQFTLTSDQYLTAYTNQLASATYASTDLTGLSSLISASGAGQTWNLGGRTYELTTSANASTVFAYPGGAPLASDPAFTTATHVVKEAVAGENNTYQYSFVRLTPDGVWALGSAMDSAGVATKTASFTPPYQMMKFPFTYGTTWQTTSNVTAPDLPPGATMTISETNNVDGYGTLVLPNGNSYPALRLSKRTITTYAFGSLGSQSDTSFSYDFYTQGGASATIGTDAQGVPTNIGYTLPTGGGVAVAATSSNALRISSNPASMTDTKIYYTLTEAAATQIDLVDITGNVRHILPASYQSSGEHELPLATAGTLAPGTYLLHLQSGAMNATQRIVVVR